MPRLLHAWREAGIEDVRAKRLSPRRRDRDVGTQEEVRPAWYALGGGGWRDYVTLLHPPYTLWHLSYVAVGAALAPRFHTRPACSGRSPRSSSRWASRRTRSTSCTAGRSRTRIPSSVLVALAVVSLAGAVAIGVGAAIAWGWGLLAFVAVGAVLVPAYNLELALPHRLGLRASRGARSPR